MFERAKIILLRSLIITIVITILLVSSLTTVKPFLNDEEALIKVSGIVITYGVWDFMYLILLIANELLEDYSDKMKNFLQEVDNGGVGVRPSIGNICVK